MTSLTVKRNSSFGDIEDYLKFLRENDNVRLRLPNTLREKGVFGLEGLVLLLLATWIRSEGEKALHTFADTGEPHEFDDLSSSMYGICGLRLSDRILTSGNDDIPQRNALEIAYKRVNDLLSGNLAKAYKGPYLAIPSIKSYGKNKEENCLLYHNGSVADSQYCKHLVDRVISSIIPKKRSAATVEAMSGSIAEMVRELFENTHKHSRTNERGDVIGINFRGVIFNASEVSSARLTSILQSAPEGMSAFFVEWHDWMEKNKKKLPVLDITVVDAGPGYARRWTGKSRNDLTPSEEIDAICKCFGKSNSSTGNPAAGYGLTHVLKGLRNRRGWFRLRTGKISVSRSYFVSPTGSLEIKPKDVKAESAFTEGSSFNIVIPLVDPKERGQ